MPTTRSTANKTAPATAAANSAAAHNVAANKIEDKLAPASGIGSRDRVRNLPAGDHRPSDSPRRDSPSLSHSAADHRAADHQDPGLSGSPSPADPWANGIDWPIVVWIAFVHVLALGAPFFFTWKALGLFVVLSWVTGSLGVCLGYHRLLTHGSFKTYKPVRWFFAFLGQMSGEGSALTWVSNHRKHHAYSDKEGDPHSPRHGGLWSHMLWFMPNHGAKWHDELTQRWAPDLAKEPLLRFLHKTFLLWQWVFGVVLYLIGWSLWDSYTGWSFVFWGVFLRTVYVFHITWFVNSATHMWGYRNYETTDDSTNLWWVGLMAFGEGWHNNHHAYQRMAKHGHKWWEVDVTYWAILALEKVGLAWNVVKEVPHHQKPA